MYIWTALRALATASNKNGISANHHSAAPCVLPFFIALTDVLAYSSTVHSIPLVGHIQEH